MSQAPPPHAPLAAPNAEKRNGLLTPDALAERWCVPKSQVYRLTRDGRLPVVKLGRYYRYCLEAVESFESGGGTDG